jgi:hypothetical protein
MQEVLVHEHEVLAGQNSISNRCCLSLISFWDWTNIIVKPKISSKQFHLKIRITSRELCQCLMPEIFNEDERPMQAYWPLLRKGVLVFRQDTQWSDAYSVFFGVPHVNARWYIKIGYKFRDLYLLTCCNCVPIQIKNVYFLQRNWRVCILYEIIFFFHFPSRFCSKLEILTDKWTYFVEWQ